MKWPHLKVTEGVGRMERKRGDLEGEIGSDKETRRGEGDKRGGNIMIYRRIWFKGRQGDLEEWSGEPNSSIWYLESRQICILSALPWKTKSSATNRNKTKAEWVPKEGSSPPPPLLLPRLRDNPSILGKRKALTARREPERDQAPMVIAEINS